MNQAASIARGTFKDSRGRDNFWEFPGRIYELLGFNEPDNSINRTPVETALQLWPVLETMVNPVRLSSPVCQRSTIDGWLPYFMTGTITYKPRTDFLVLHWYQRSAWDFLAYVDKWYERYRLPVWITEFSITNWAFMVPTTASITHEEAIQFILVALTGLEQRIFVEKYSWYSNPCDPSIVQGSLWTQSDPFCSPGFVNEQLGDLGVLYYNITTGRDPTRKPTPMPSKAPVPIRTKSGDAFNGHGGISVDGVIALIVILGTCFFSSVGYIVYRQWTKPPTTVEFGYTAAI